MIGDKGCVVGRGRENDRRQRVCVVGRGRENDRRQRVCVW